MLHTNIIHNTIAPMDTELDSHGDNLTVFLANVQDRVHHFNWQILITIPLNDGTT